MDIHGIVEGRPDPNVDGILYKFKNRNVKNVKECVRARVRERERVFPVSMKLLSYRIYIDGTEGSPSPGENSIC